MLLEEIGLDVKDIINTRTMEQQAAHYRALLELARRNGQVVLRVALDGIDECLVGVLEPRRSMGRSLTEAISIAIERDNLR